MARNWRQPGHLPHHRSDEPSPPEELPTQRRGVAPQMRGRYPDYDVLALASHWDEVTRKLVEERAAETPRIEYFSKAEARTLRAFCDLVLAQDHEPKVPVVEMVDAKFSKGELDGFRFEDMPSDDETWRRVAAGLDHRARQSFAELDYAERRRLTESFASGDLEGGPWDELNCARAWSVVMRGALSAFYSHPWAWNEIGYGGPRYPRGYMRLQAGAHEPGGAAESFSVDPVADVGRSG